MSAALAEQLPHFRKDYCAPFFLIDQVELEFDLYENETIVLAKLQLRRNPDCIKPDAPLVLDGEELELLSLSLNGVVLAEDDFEVDEQHLIVHNVPDHFWLTTRVLIHPENNTRLEGLYISSGKFCTQCEAEGFRRITYFLDRPDVMATYRVSIRAEKSRYPYLLSNGNKVSQRDIGDDRHEVIWFDPFRKPCYLFALVAGDLDLMCDYFITRSGRRVALEIYVDRGKLDQCGHAMKSLKKSMAWDEQRYGLEYDLDIYMIVAVSDFNMGAMENKGLNIFNTKYVLAHSDTATDFDYEGVESVIAHEYFHNWTGNRVTCRDWFQLSLKEGLTVFRDQQFSQDMGSSTVKRIDDVRVMRTAQFSEDAGPMAHPIRPESYVEMNNFYTVTVYNKGAEVIRMAHRLLGEAGFRKGMDCYFSRHDGQAVTCDDFINALSDSNDVDLSLFRKWYSTSGTPVVRVSDEYDQEKNIYRLTLTQQLIQASGKREVLDIPIEIGLLNQNGDEWPLRWKRMESSGNAVGTSSLLRLNEPQVCYEFSDITSQPVPSLLRDFSAPVKLYYPYTIEQLAMLMANDRNGFNRWDAAQQLYSQTIFKLADGFRSSKQSVVPDYLLQAVTAVVNDDQGDHALRARLLQLPDLVYLAEQVEVLDVEALDAALHVIRTAIAETLKPHFLSQFERYRGNVSLLAQGVAERAWSNTCLHYLLQTNDNSIPDIALDQALRAGTMTDRAAATRLLAHSTAPQRAVALQNFALDFAEEALVMDKWFTMQASSPQNFALENTRQLMQHPAFDWRNPNKVRALLSGFTQNLVQFHRADGEGYRFIADQVIYLNAINPQVAARLVSSFNRWRKFDEPRQQLMLQQLKRILQAQGLSPDVHEIVNRSLS